jgi:F-box-like
MLSPPVVPALFGGILPELLLVIFAYIPLAYRTPTLLSGDLTCRRFCDVVMRCLPYQHVRLLG